MKIGIVTQPLIGNYGGILQNYALQTVLRRLGHEPITIDYLPELSWTRYLASTAKSSLLWPFSKVRREFAKRRSDRQNEVIDDFVETHIVKTEKVYRYRQSIVDHYGLDAIIAGSDQIWRPMYNLELSDMYLGFVNNQIVKKVAYAASFGTSEKEYTSKQIRKCKKAAQNLYAVSVREASGLDLCKEYFGIKAQHVLDPTLLLLAEDYKNLIAETPVTYDKFLGAYILDDNPVIDEIIKIVSSDNNIKSIRRVEENDNLSLQEWIAMFRDASFIITDSFHGTVFSIIFQKPFLSLYNYSRGGDRFISLLQSLGLLDRIIGYDSTDIRTIMVKDIDWESVAKELDFCRKESLSFLAENLS